MKIIKISPQCQITIPMTFRHLCETGYFASYTEENSLILRPIQITPAKSEDEILQEIIHGGTDGTQ